MEIKLTRSSTNAYTSEFEFFLLVKPTYDSFIVYRDSGHANIETPQQMQSQIFGYFVLYAFLVILVFVIQMKDIEIPIKDRTAT